MKSLWISALLCVSVLVSQAQEKEEKDPNEFRTRKNELGIGMFNAFALSSNPSPNISYKRYTENGALRVSVGGKVSSENNQVNSSNASTFTKILKDLNSNNAINFNVGYERHIPMNRWMLFTGVDLFGIYSETKYELIRQFDGGVYNSVPYTYNDEILRETTTMSLGLMTFLGVKFWVNDRISINTQFETRFLQHFTNYKKADNKIYSIPELANEIQETITKSNGLSAYISPLGLLSFNFHF